jgi:hypothetical protein
VQPVAAVKESAKTTDCWRIVKHAFGLFACDTCRLLLVSLSTSGATAKIYYDFTQRQRAAEALSIKSTVPGRFQIRLDSRRRLRVAGKAFTRRMP